MILYLDTSEPETKIALYEKGEILAKKVWLSDKNQSEELLFEIEGLIKSIHRDKFDLKQIIVVNGPGTYTGLRVGLSTTNALALSLNIEIIGVEADSNWKNPIGKTTNDNAKFGIAVMPKYSYPPKITKAKSRR